MLPIFEEKPHQQEALDIVWIQKFGAQSAPPLIEWYTPDPTCNAKFPNSAQFVARIDNECKYGSYSLYSYEGAIVPIVKLAWPGSIYESWLVHELTHAYAHLDHGLIDYEHKSVYFTSDFMTPAMDALISRKW